MVVGFNPQKCTYAEHVRHGPSGKSPIDLIAKAVAGPAMESLIKRAVRRIERRQTLKEEARARTQPL